MTASRTVRDWMSMAKTAQRTLSEVSVRLARSEQAERDLTRDRDHWRARALQAEEQIAATAASWPGRA